MSDLPSTISHVYSEGYRELAFQCWYKAGRPVRSRLREILPPDDEGIVPSTETLTDWRERYVWDARADQMDIEVQRQVQEATIKERVEMFLRHAEVAKALIEEGKVFIRKEGVDSSADAIRAIVEGIKIERESVGLPDALLKLASASTEKLDQLITGLLAKASPADIQELTGGPAYNTGEDTENSDGEIVDGQFTE